MIRRVVIRNFKRFGEVVFEIPGHVVIAGPNNTGKTTMLQAIATWSLALKEWRTLNDFNKRNGYSQKPIARQAFSSVPLRNFELLWTQRKYQGLIEIGVETSEWSLTMELIANSTEQIYARPKSNAEASVLRAINLDVVYVPSMSGLSIEEPVYQRPYIEQRLGQARPGEVLRNLLVEAHTSSTAWQKLQQSIDRLFGYTLRPPVSTGAFITAEYSTKDKNAPAFDIASAGSGFQQVLMLLTFLTTRPASVLLLDEPDAHLHVILQDAIFGELRSMAADQKSQLIIATHSEKIINAADPSIVCAMLDRPKLLARSAEQRTLINSLGALSNVDIMLALSAPGVIYTEDYTDLEILRAWANVLKHPAYETLTKNLFWQRVVVQPRSGAEGISAKEHFDALRLVKEDIPGLELVDGDAHRGKASTEINGKGLQRLRWRRYEVESYLIHPKSLERFVENQVGPSAAGRAQKDMYEYLTKTLTKEFVEDPFGNHPLVEAYLEQRKARTEVLPPILTAAGILGFPYQEYFKIAKIMLPDEIHPEVKEKLDQIQKAFRL